MPRQPVTDPAILAQLNGDAPTAAPRRRAPVSDPALLAQLNDSGSTGAPSPTGLPATEGTESPPTRGISTPFFGPPNVTPEETAQVLEEKAQQRRGIKRATTKELYEKAPVSSALAKAFANKGPEVPAFLRDEEANQTRELDTELGRLRQKSPPAPKSGNIASFVEGFVNFPSRAKAGYHQAVVGDVGEEARRAGKSPDEIAKAEGGAAAESPVMDFIRHPGAAWKGMGAYGTAGFDRKNPSYPEAFADTARRVPVPTETLPGQLVDGRVVSTDEDPFGRMNRRIATQLQDHGRGSLGTEGSPRPTQGNMTPEEAARKAALTELVTMPFDPATYAQGAVVGKALGLAGKGVSKVVGGAVRTAADAGSSRAAAIERFFTPGMAAEGRQGEVAARRAIAAMGTPEDQAIAQAVADRRLAFERTPKGAIGKRAATQFSQIEPRAVQRIDEVRDFAKGVQGMTPEETALAHQALQGDRSVINPALDYGIKPELGEATAVARPGASVSTPAQQADLIAGKASRDRVRGAVEGMDRFAQKYGDEESRLFGMQRAENYIPKKATPEAVRGLGLSDQTMAAGQELPLRGIAQKGTPALGSHFSPADFYQSLSEEAQKMGQPALRGPAEANAFIAANPENPVVASMSKRAQLQSGGKFYQEDIGKLAAQSYLPRAKEVEFGRFLEQLKPSTVPVGSSMTVPEGFVKSSVAGQKLGSGAISKVLGEDAAIPKVWVDAMMKKYGPQGPPGMTGPLLNAWKRAVTVYSGAAYHMRNLRTSAETMLGEMGVGRSARSIEDAARTMAGEDLAVAPRAGLKQTLGRAKSRLQGVPDLVKETGPQPWSQSSQKIQQGLADMGLAKGAGRPVTSAYQEARAAAGLDTGQSMLQKAKGAALKPLASAASGSDEAFRLAMAIDAVRQGTPLPEALERASSLITHTQNLSPAMESVRKIMPFAPWTIRAAPMQLTQALSGKAQPAQLFANYMKARAPKDTQAAPGLMPDFLAKGVSYPLGRQDESGNKMYGYDSAAPQNSIAFLDPAYQAAAGHGSSAALGSARDVVGAQINPGVKALVQMLNLGTKPGQHNTGDLERIASKPSPWLAAAGGKDPSELANAMADMLPYRVFPQIAQAKTQEERNARIWQALGFGVSPVDEDMQRYGQAKQLNERYDALRHNQPVVKRHHPAPVARK